MDVFEAIKGRRSIRQYADKAIGQDLLERLLDAARWAPSASNQQRWRFVAVTSSQTKGLIKQFAPGIFSMPAAFIVICIEKEPGANPWAKAAYWADCAIAAQNIMLAAYAEGIGSCIVLSFSGAAIKEILDIPEGIEPLFVLTLGYPVETPQPPSRLALHQIAFVDAWGKEWPL